MRPESRLLHGGQRGWPRCRNHPGRPRRRRRRPLARATSSAYTVTITRWTVRAAPDQQTGGGESEVPSMRNICTLCRLHAGADLQSTACNAIHSIEQRTAKWIISAMERAEGDNTVPLTHEQLATLSASAKYTSRVIQPGWQRRPGDSGSILVRCPVVLRRRSCRCNEAVKNHFEEVGAGCTLRKETILPSGHP